MRFTLFLLYIIKVASYVSLKITLRRFEMTIIGLKELSQNPGKIDIDSLVAKAKRSYYSAKETHR